MNSRVDSLNWRNKRGNVVVQEKKEINIRHFDLLVQKDLYVRLKDIYSLMYNNPVDKTQGQWIEEHELNIRESI